MKHLEFWSRGAVPSKMILKKRKKTKRRRMHSLWKLTIVIGYHLYLTFHCCCFCLSAKFGLFILFEIVSFLIIYMESITTKDLFHQENKVICLFFSFHAS